MLLSSFFINVDKSYSVHIILHISFYLYDDHTYFFKNVCGACLSV